MNLPPQRVVPNIACQICNKMGHSARLYNESGNFAYIAGTLVDNMSSTRIMLMIIGALIWVCHIT